MGNEDRPLFWKRRTNRSGASGEKDAEVISLEQRLVMAARRGDKEAFGKLHQSYVRTVHGVLLSRIPPAEVSDLAQEVFLTAWQKLDQLDDKAAFGPWVCAIARNKSTDFLRRRRTFQPLPEEFASVRPTPRVEALEALEALRSLPETYRETLMLRLVEGMTGPEIAQKTGLTPASVRVNLHRGMKLLREKLNVRGST